MPFALSPGELAEKRNDRYHLGVVLENVGVLHRACAEQANDSESRVGHLQQAVSSIEESLAIKLEMKDQVAAASSGSALSTCYLETSLVQKSTFSRV